MSNKNTDRDPKEDSQVGGIRKRILRHGEMSSPWRQYRRGDSFDSNTLGSTKSFISPSSSPYEGRGSRKSNVSSGFGSGSRSSGSRDSQLSTSTSFGEAADCINTSPSRFEMLGENEHNRSTSPTIKQVEKNKVNTLRKYT